MEDTSTEAIERLSNDGMVEKEILDAMTDRYAAIHEWMRGWEENKPLPEGKVLGHFAVEMTRKYPDLPNDPNMESLLREQALIGGIATVLAKQHRQIIEIIGNLHRVQE